MKNFAGLGNYINSDHGFRIFCDDYYSSSTVQSESIMFSVEFVTGVRCRQLERSQREAL